MTKTISRIARLKYAKRDFDNAREYSPDSVENPAKILVDMLLDVAVHNPAPADSPQSRPEAFLAESIARELFEKNAYLMNYCGWYRDVFQIIQDPSMLSGSISRSLVERPGRDAYVKYQEILEIALDLGGVVMPEHVSTSSNMINPTEARNKYFFSDVSQAKKLLENQIRNHWAVEYAQAESFQYANFVIFATGYVADHDPQWSVDFVLRNSAYLQELFSNHPVDIQAGDAKAIATVLNGTATTKMLVAMRDSQPELFEVVMNSGFMGTYLQKLLVLPEFKLSSLVPHLTLDQDQQAYLFVKCGRHNAMTDDRFTDLDLAWRKSGFSEKLISVVRASEAFVSMSTSLDEYKSMLRSPDLAPAEIVKSKGQYGFAGHNFPLFDALVSKATNRISRTEALMVNHSAYMMTATWMSDKTGPATPVKAITIGTAILGLMTNKFNDRLKAFVETAFTDQSNHKELAKVSGDLIDMALNVLPKVDRESLRKINWEDRAFKGRMIEEDLGM